MAPVEIIMEIMVTLSRCKFRFHLPCVHTNFINNFGVTAHLGTFNLGSTQAIASD